MSAAVLRGALGGGSDTIRSSAGCARRASELEIHGVKPDRKGGCHIAKIHHPQQGVEVVSHAFVSLEGQMVARWRTS